MKRTFKLALLLFLAQLVLTQVQELDNLLNEGCETSISNPIPGRDGDNVCDR